MQAITVLALIPARGGSVRLPGKNMRKFGGQPLVGWAIDCAEACDCFQTTAVTSDSAAVLDYARYVGIKTIKRPAALATSEASVYDAIRHAYAELAYPYSMICLLQPTSPLRLPSDILACISTLMSGDAPAVASCAAGSDVPNGAVYVAHTSWLLDGGSWDNPGVTLVNMPVERSVDINTLEDFEEAERHLETMFRLKTY